MMTVDGTLVIETDTEWAVRTPDGSIILADCEEDARDAARDAAMLDTEYKPLSRRVYLGAWEDPA